MQAAVLCAKLPWLDEWTARRRRLAGQYDQGLAGFGLTTPYVPSDCLHAYHGYVVQTQHRSMLARFLRQCGIPVDCLPPQPMLRQFEASRLTLRCGPMIQVDRLSRQSLTLPISPDMTSHNIRYIVNCIRQAPCTSNSSHEKPKPTHLQRPAPAVARM
jgi:dTDP-3-amino-3,4,6-trideoxy-alpha-D-glucose transaminase